MLAAAASATHPPSSSSPSPSPSHSSSPSTSPSSPSSFPCSSSAASSVSRTVSPLAAGAPPPLPHLRPHPTAATVDQYSTATGDDAFIPLFDNTRLHFDAFLPPAGYGDCLHDTVSPTALCLAPPPPSLDMDHHFHSGLVDDYTSTSVTPTVQTRNPFFNVAVGASHSNNPYSRSEPLQTAAYSQHHHHHPHQHLPSAWPLDPGTNASTSPSSSSNNNNNNNNSSSNSNTNTTSTLSDTYSPLSFDSFSPNIDGIDLTYQLVRPDVHLTQQLQGSLFPTTTSSHHDLHPLSPIAHAPAVAAVDPQAHHTLQPHSQHLSQSATLAYNMHAQPMPTDTPTPQDYMLAAEQDLPNARPIPKRMRPASPPRSGFAAQQRRDGIRKKNARFEIPRERSLHNIDQLILQSTDEDEIKELKQQKRLLRNRQAALDSRQRKKKHTENLEEEKKVQTEVMQQQEDELQSLKNQHDCYLQEKREWHLRHVESQRIIEALTSRQKELVREHTIETGNLRRKITLLTERLESAPSMASSMTSSATFCQFTSGMEGLSMDGSEWEAGFYPQDCHMETAIPSHGAVAGVQQPILAATATAKPTSGESSPTLPSCSTALVVANQGTPSSTVTVTADADKPVSTGLLVLLLLVGSFVASKSSGSTAPAIPRMPDDVRAASATVLDSIFKDAGVAPDSSGPAANSAVLAMNALSSRNRQGRDSAAPMAWQGIGPAASLDRLHTDLTTPSAELQAEAVFSMTPAQYNGVMEADFTQVAYDLSAEGANATEHYDGDYATKDTDVDEEDEDDEDDADDDVMTPKNGGSLDKTGDSRSGRRNLAATLAAMREQSKGNSAAEVYSRSLLWNKNPTEVVVEFKKMMEEANQETAVKREIAT